tara:strand:- start:1834 stop:2172 length:339 start_codon:yes stop_codon:yes gene_type:complete
MNSFLSIFITLQLLSGESSTPNEELGKKIYLKRCKVCHGAKGDTNPFAAKVLNPPPRNFTSEQSKKELTEERMVFSATNGRPGTAMMPWKGILSQDEIFAVIYYIRNELMNL